MASRARGYPRPVQLEHLVALLPHVDVAAAYDAWCAEQGSTDVDAFTAHLRETGVMAAAGFVTAHATESLTVSTPDELDTLAGLSSTSTREAPEAPAPPEESERYRLLGPIGKGAMGVVHLARDRELQRKVAIKQLSGNTDDALVVRRFLGEAQITAQLDHPNVVPVYGLELGNDGAAYAMKLVDGRTLAEVIEDAHRDDDPKARRARLAELLETFVKVCDAVAFAHKKGVIHRDLKPANIMVGPFGEVYVMDWGLAREYGAEHADPDTSAIAVTNASAAETQAGALVGTPAYMAPEQAHGRNWLLGPGSDQFALGLILFEIVNGRRAYPESQPSAVLKRAWTASKDRYDPYASAELAAIADRATALEVPDRYPDVQAFAADIRRHLRGDETVALPDDLFDKLRRWMVRHQKQTLAIGLTVVLLAIGLVVWSQLRERARLAEARVEAQRTEAALSGFVNDVAQRGQRLANHFLWYEGLTEGLVGAARHAMLRGAGEATTYSWSDYLGGKGPAGIVQSPHYDRPISPDHGVTACSPRAPAATCQSDVGRLGTLRQHMQRLFAGGPEDTVPTRSIAELRKRIVDHITPIQWVYVALETGTMFMFPGASGYLDHKYDPRTRPWYRQGKKAHSDGAPRRRIWSRPYVDMMGQGRVITCIQPLMDDDGRFLGVASLDLGFNSLIDQHLAMPDLPGFVASYLLDADGTIMITSAARNAPYTRPRDSTVKDDGLDFGAFGQPEVRKAVQEGRSGSLTAESPEGPRLIAWTRLQHMGWALVVVADRASIVQAEPALRPRRTPPARALP